MNLKKWSSLGITFWTHFVILFTSAFVDNFLKNALIVYVLFNGIEAFGLPTNLFSPIAAALFILPYLLFSHFAGQWSDISPKRIIIVTCKMVELIIGCLALFFFPREEILGLLFCVFMLGVHSTFFGPAKYALIKDLVKEEQFILGTALVEAGTFIAILMGTMSGAWMIAFDDGVTIIPWSMIALSIFSLMLTFKFMPKNIGFHGKVDQKFKWSFNLFQSTGEMFKQAKTFPKLSPVIQAISFFYFLGAYVITVLPAMAKNDLHGSEQLVSWMFAIFSIGIACGAIYYDRISKKGIRIQPMFFSIFAMTFFLLVMALLLSFQSDTTWHFVAIFLTFFGVSFFSGMYSTPLYALLQKIPSEEWRSQAIATNNVANSIYVLLAAICIMGFYALEISHAMMFVFAALLWISTLLYLVPHFPVPFYRLVFYVGLRLFYKLKIKNWEKFPAKGPYVIISNHISFIDWLFLGYLTEKQFSFVVWYKYYFFPIMNIFFRHVNAIPIAGKKEDVKILEESFPKMVQVLKDGDFLFLFPEGGISRTGEMDFFRPGVIEVLKQFPVPVVPVKLNNLWGSIFSRSPEKYALNNVFKKIRPEIEIIIGDPIVVTHDKAGLLTLENAVKNLL